MIATNIYTVCMKTITTASIKLSTSGQCVLTYDFNGENAVCGLTFFQCGVAPVIILSDLGKNISVTNSIEAAASTARSLYFTYSKPEHVLVLEHYRRENGADEFFQVKMRWNRLNECYANPRFSNALSMDELIHLLACYGYSRSDMPGLSFTPAKIIQFPFLSKND